MRPMSGSVEGTDYVQRVLQTFPIWAVKYPASCSFLPIIVRFALHSVCDVMPRLVS